MTDPEISGSVMRLISTEKTHKDSGAHFMNMLILYMVQKNHTGPYYRVQASFMADVAGLRLGPRPNAAVAPIESPVTVRLLRAIAQFASSSEFLGARSLSRSKGRLSASTVKHVH